MADLSQSWFLLLACGGVIAFTAILAFVSIHDAMLDR